MTTLSYHRTYVRYADVLEAFITKYKSRPPDIKFWPYGPYWPVNHPGPVVETPYHIRTLPKVPEPLCDNKGKTLRTVENQETEYKNRWRGVQIVYDSERSSKDYEAPSVSEGHCPCLTFESRFECGNLRQARRIGQYEYELVLNTDLYTKRHTQWYYFRVQNAVPGVTYRFKIVNLLKRNSLYNYGMRPLFYSEENAATQGIGWVRAGHHISYSRNLSNLHCPLLHREMAYYMLEWQMEFPHADDTYYLAHCYPYTYTDLKDDLDTLLNDTERSICMKREVMCETRAGNSCFLVTVTNFELENKEKKGVIVSARVHPGESQSSWMMKGLLDFITSNNPTAKELRKKFIFKIVPMLNPDGVIVGNYRCSLAGRDLNRNYRHPRRESFPTVWHIKHMMEEFGKYHQIMVYCDLHGHSRKSNVFMYGCNTNRQASGATTAETFIKERLFPWLMAQKAPERFSFNGCKFQIKKCKESTGRVVMFRQLQIPNSFTMEATFSGSTICKGDKRHFNLRDFEEIGKVFGEVALEYEKMQNNKVAMSEAVIDLTRLITHQILQSRGMLPANVPIFSTDTTVSNKGATNDESNKISSSKQVTAAICAMVTKENSHNNSQTRSEVNKWTKQPSESVAKPMTNEQIKKKSKDLTKMDVNNLLDNMSGKTIDDCICLLEKLNITDTCLESDSSDSDSESEPEMKYKESSKKKKKKKRKSKNETRELGEKKQRDKSTPDKTKTSATLPAIGDAGSFETNKKQKFGNTNPFVKKNGKLYPAFVNKYEGRSNGGIPCFSEERSHERAAKKMSEMHKKMEEEKQKHQVIYYPGDMNGHSQSLEYPTSWSLNHSRTYADLRQQVADAVHGKGATSIRTGYTHAEPGSPDLVPDIVPGVQHLQPTISQSYSDLYNDSSTDSEEDDEVRDTEYETEIPKPMPLPALNSPYQNVSSMMNVAVQPFMHNASPRLMRLQRDRSHSLSTVSQVTGMSKPLIITPKSVDVSTKKMNSAGNIPSVRPVQKSGFMSMHPARGQEAEIAPHSTATTQQYTDFILQRFKDRNTQPALRFEEPLLIRQDLHQRSTAD